MLQLSHLKTYYPCFLLKILPSSLFPLLSLWLLGAAVRSSAWRMRNSPLRTTQRTLTLFDFSTFNREPVAEEEKKKFPSLPFACLHCRTFYFFSPVVSTFPKFSPSHFCMHTERTLGCQGQPPFIYIITSSCGGQKNFVCVIPANSIPAGSITEIIF